LQDCRIAGLQDCRIAGLQDCRIAGLPFCNLVYTRHRLFNVLQREREEVNMSIRASADPSTIAKFSALSADSRILASLHSCIPIALVYSWRS
jgi:hypothetical protein